MSNPRKIGPEERHKILVEWNQTVRDYPRDKCLHQLFEEQVQRTPHAVAVEFEGQCLSYHELNARANQLANYLRTHGVGPEILVGVYAVRSLEMVVSLLGIMKAGGAYVPIDPEYPAERVRHMLSDSGVTVLLTQNHLVTSLPSHSAMVFCLDTHWEKIASLANENLDTDVTTSNLAYMIYTSGSTGKPKGAMNAHRGIVNRLMWMQDQFELAPTDVVMQKTPFSFDISVWEFFWPLLNGARLSVAMPGGHRDADYLVRFIQAHRVTIVHFVPSMLRLFLEHSGIEGCTSLRHVCCGGEALTADLRNRFFARLNVPLQNLYGPTEAAVDVTHWTCLRDQTLPFVPIGRPIANTQCYILDSQLEPLPIGESGELFLGGVQIGRGYYKLPELTSQKFIPDPFQSNLDARLYKTGDLCRFLDDGNIQFLGRIDNQVKIRGFRIELDEIESVLVSHPDLSHCVVNTEENEHEEKTLSAYVVPVGQTVLSIGSLRKWLAERLPEYMIPSRFFSVTAIPLSPNGKVDRRALKTSNAVELETGTTYRAPQTNLEIKLAEIWQTILGRERISVDDNFFELGGHSLSAMRLVSTISKQLSREVLVKWVFEHTTVEKLAQKLIEIQDDNRQFQSIPLIDRSQPLPASFGQHAMWLVQALLPDSATYNQPIAILLTGRIDRAIVDHCIEQIALRHDSLRTAFVQSGETLVQYICEPAEFALNARVISLQLPATDQRQQALQAALLEEARRPFDLAVAPLWRVLWIELADDEVVLEITFHHSIIDEWSLRIFCSELSALYRTKGDLQAASLHELPIQYADYAVWQRARIATVEWEQSIAYWKEQLADLPPALELPSDKVRPAQPASHGAIHEFRLGVRLTGRLRQLARDESATLFTLMLAVFNVWLARHTGQTDIIVGTPLADRDRPEVQPLMGYFLNTLPIRTRLEGNPPFRRVLRQIHQTLMDAYSHSDIPFERLVELVVKHREPGRHPIYQVMFVLLEDSIVDLQISDVTSRTLWPHSGTSKNDLRLDIHATSDEWICQIEYATDLFTQPLIERFAVQFQTLLEEITSTPEAFIQQLPLLTESETQQIVKKWNQTSVIFHDVQTIHQFFERQVELTPESDAIVFNDSRMSYRQLNERANALANRLISSGTKPESLVGLFADRSLETMVALLGILKAGAAYVPLDPSYPEARLRSIIHDARIEIVILQEHLSAQLTEGNFQRIVLKSSDSNDVSNVENPPHIAGPSHLAYVLYTSGSTGRPKGVAMEHRALTNLIQWQIHQYPSHEHFRTLQFASLGFDVSFQEIFSTWCSGGTLVLIDENTRRDMSLFFKYIESEQLERIFVPFVVLQQFIEASEAHLQMTLSLREVVTAGEQLRITPQLVRFFENNSGCRLVNQYGPTEAHVVTSYRLDGSPLDWPLLPPIGRPIANIQAYVLDPHLQPLPEGLSGELYLGGVGVARGYLNQPDLTAEKFLPDPFSDQAGSRLYRTGDKVRWNADGQLEFLGRIDQQVKFRGYRIELGEIEATLNQAPSVAQTLVMLREDQPGEKRLVAYVVPTNATAIPSTDDMRFFLRNQLPEYMIPSIFVAIPNLPLTVNGKVDRRALPIPNYELSGGNRCHIAPRTPLEQILADSWKSVLGIERISVDDNFFELGGHSLLAMRLVSTIGSQLNREVLVKWVFENPTVEQLSQKLIGIQGDNRPLQPISLVDRSQPLPLSFGQHSMWLVQALLPDSATYNQPIAMRLTGRIDRAVVTQAIEQIARRHESLRTAFVQSGETLVQHICKPAEFAVNLRVISLQQPTTDQHQQALQATLLEEVRQPFDLAVVPLWRVLWIELADDDQVLVLTFHHSIIDEWSLQIFYRELSALYQSAGNVDAASLPELPIQYVDYSVWQRTQQASAAWEQSIAYWKDQLADLPPALDLPTDKVRPMQLSGEGAIHEFRLSAPLTGQLRQLARDESVTLFTLMLAVSHVWLARHTGQSDIIVGTPVAHRERPEVQSLIGYFLNTLPIRARLDGKLTFRSVLEQIHQNFWNAYKHAEIPFQQLVELSLKQRELGRHPIYQVMFVLLEGSIEETRFGDEICQPIWVPTGTSKNELALDIQATADEWVCRLEYASDLFSADAVASMADHFTELLWSIAEEADSPIGKLNLIGQDERQKILVEWNQTDRDFARDKCLHQVFEERVQRTPHAIAVTFEGQSLTYGDLNSRANQLAHFLRAEGVGPDMLVGVYAERSMEMVVSLFGILKAGGAYVPIDPEYPAERVSYMLSDSSVTVLLTQNSLVASLPAHSAKVFCLDTDWKKISTLTDLNPVTEVKPSNLAYMIYTSGSTGKPKGAMNTHLGIVNRLIWMQEQYGLSATDVVLQKTPFSFDVSVWEFFWPLLNGARLCVTKPGGHRDADYLVRFIQDNHITVLHFVPSMLRLFLEHGGVEGCTSLRHVICSGEALSADLRNQFFTRLDVPLHNLYGPTEAAVDVTHWTCHRDEKLPFVPIGRPVANTQCYILDTHLEPVPIGVSGELFLGGVQIGRGYHNQSELTSQKFIRDPFQAAPNARLYKTGDLCRFLNDGNIQFLGRIDNQVKVRGFRIELDEIESILVTHPDILNCVVSTDENESAETTLAAYVVPADQLSLSVGSLRKWLAERLPDYMIPSRFFSVAAIPLSPNGKVDRRALKASNARKLETGKTYKAPQTDLEIKLAEIWQTVMGRERIGVDDNFFELGGHSLMAMRLVSTVSERLHRRVLVKWVFENPTVEQLAQKLIGIRDDHRPIQSIPVIDRSQPLPLSFGQHSMWLVQALLTGSATYNQPIAIRLTGRVDRAVINQSIEQIARRHESLRTTFVQSVETLVQYICDPSEFVVNRREISLQRPTADQSQQVLQATLLDEVRQPFDLAVAPLWRVLWIELADDNQVLVLTFHHSIIDEWSMRIFCGELSALCQTGGKIQGASLPVLPIQYADYAVWQHARLDTAEWEQSVVYWKEQLADLPPALDLPTDKVRPIQLSGEGAIYEFRLSDPLTSQLRTLARNESTTLFSLMLAVFHVWLARHTGQTDLIVGTPLANRERPEVQSLIGYFLNTLPIRARLEGKLAFRSVLRQIHQTFRDAYTHAEIPFERLVELTVKERELGRHPIYQVMFILLEESLEELRFGDAISQPISVDTGTSKNDLTLEIQVTGNEWICRFEYATDLFGAEAVVRMADHFIELMRSIVNDPDCAIDQLNLIGPDERHKILVEWNQTARDYPRDKCLHQLFEEQVRRTPEAVAVEFEGQSLTYGELNARANQLARYLRTQGVGPEMLVGVYTERSLEMVVSLFGILKAGGAYVPIDPEYPAERVSYMLADAVVTVLLTQSHLVSTLPSHSATVFCLDTDWKNISSLEGVNPDTNVTPSDLAYMIYTSGSTGKPKGALNTHLGIVNQIYWIQEQYNLVPTDVVLQKTPFSFDVSVWEFFWPLLNGARLCVAMPGGHRDAGYLVDVIQAHHVTVAVFVPSMLQLFLEHSEVERCTSLRHVICIGEALPADLRDRFFARLDAPLHNLYGPAEAAVSVTHWTCCRDQTLPFVPIGRPVSNTQCYILDTNLEPVPIGVSGELYLGGVQIGRGYHNQPELTAQKFISDPFQSDPEARLYKTGDLCLFLSDGNIHFLGRIDNQVKIRGFRIELDEIESVLASNSDVSHCVVSTAENERGEKTLEAYLIPAENSVLSVGLLRKWLAEKLPDYMIPSRYFSITAIPLSPNGKVDRRALKKLSALELETETEYQPPRTNLEFQLTEIWQKLLGREKIGVFDNFFELGGHSLLAVRVVDAMKSSMGITIKIADVFRHATVSELAESLSNPTQTSEVSHRGQYLESIRSGNGDTHLVIVGAKLRVPLEVLPPEIPVWWLKLDGLHVWPPKHLDVPAQAAIHAQELSHEIPSGTILLCGNSYGGTLAIAIAQQLKQMEKHKVKLILLEPPLWSTQQEPIIKKVKRKLKEFKDRDHSQNVREVSRALYKSTIGRVKNLIIRQRKTSDQEIAVDDRWVYMEPFFQQNAGAFQLPNTTALNVHLIKTRSYDKVSFERLKQSAKHSLHIHSTPEHLDHYEMADPQNSMVWMDIVLQLIDLDTTHHPSSTSGHP